jgi:phosphatidylserine/phosphatidylglycerophosphate/cardiolipin synthase-like enzyme
MRDTFHSDTNKLHAAVFAGTRAILIALNIDDGERAGLKGFAFKRIAPDGTSHWLTGMKVFPSLAPQQPAGDGKNIHFPTNENPIQSLIWSDYEASPETTYQYEVSAMYGAPGNLQPRHTVTLKIKTEAENDGRHGIWVNRGAIASQRFAEKFQNTSLTLAQYNDPGNEEVQWLSRGLLEACLAYIRETPAGAALRVCAYEFTYQPVLLELKAAMKRGVDVRIIFHATSANAKEIAKAALPKKNAEGKQILFERTRPKTPHNKFIVRLEGGTKPVAVWTGSTNFTPSGFLGQTNVGHLVTDPKVAATYLELWNGLTANPLPAAAKTTAVRLSPNPANVPPKGTSMVFSARLSDLMLQWYGARISDAATSAMFTGAFSVDPNILAPMAKQGPAMRFILLERPPTAEIDKARTDNPADLMFSYGAVLGKMQQMTGTDETGKKTKKWAPIPHFKLEKWFLGEELERKTGQGFIFFIHTKFLLVDALSDDPLVCTGSANFSSDSLKSNDENMLLIRGDTRVADIYLTEFDRVFRHFASRDAINEIAKRRGTPSFGLLDETDKWWGPYFDPANAKNHRRLMFFADAAKAWPLLAANDPSVFIGEGKKGGGKSKPATSGAKKKKKTAKKAKTGVKKAGVKKASAKKKAASKKTGNKKKTAAKKKRTSPKKSGKKARKSTKKSRKR